MQGSGNRQQEVIDIISSARRARAMMADERPDPVVYSQRIVDIAPASPVQRAAEANVAARTPEEEYRSVDMDEYFVRIAAIEAENTYPVQVATVVEESAIVESSDEQVSIIETIKRHTIVTRLKALPTSPIIAGFAVAILGLTGYVTFDTWSANNAVREVVAQERSTDSSSAGEAVAGASTEGVDETDINAEVIKQYKVAGDLPRVLSIDRIGVKARVLPMGVNNDGSLQAPVNIFDSGWYSASAKPGTKGAALIDGHASGSTREGLFGSLNTLKRGDIVSVELGNGSLLKYEVVHTETVALNDVDMSKLLMTYGSAEEGLNLITCTGKWAADKNTYDSRALVYTKRIY